MVFLTAEESWDSSDSGFFTVIQNLHVLHAGMSTEPNPAGAEKTVLAVFAMPEMLKLTRRE